MNKYLLILVIFLSGCAVNGNMPQSALDTLYAPKYARRFAILSHGDTVILSVKNPWQGAENTEKRYDITKPFEKIIATSTSHLAFLETLESTSLVKGISGKSYIYSKAYANVEDIGYDRSMEYEKVLAIGSDAMLVYEIAGESASAFGKLESLGVNVIYIADYLENDPLGRAEWIMVFGAMTGKMEKAAEYFAMVEDSYNSLKVDSVFHRKKVILNSPYRDIWYFPGTDSYPIKLIEDAGGEYIASRYKGEMSTPVGIETAYRYLLEADIWLNPSIGTKTMADLERSDARLKGISIPLYNFDKRSTQTGGTDYYETGVVRPDLILRDLRHILDSTNLDSLYFYQRILP